MAIKVYVGFMGSGKSYEVVTNVIVPALGRGRRVISNIAGLQFDLIKAHLIAEKNVSEDQIGELISVDHDAVLDPQFWLTDKDDLSTRDAAFMRPGDLVCLDEIWRFWEGFRRPHDRVLNFVRMHRHMLDENGVSSDLALVTQDIMDVGPPVRRVVEETYRMTKLTMVGAVKKYRIDVYAGAQSRDDKPLRQFFRSYDEKFFPMYSSHSLKKEGQEAKEENIDQRGNILNHPGIKYGVPAGLLLFIALTWLGISSVSQMTGTQPLDQEITGSQAEEKTPETRTSSKPPVSEFEVNGKIRAFVSSSSGTVIFTNESILLNPPAAKITPLTVEVFSPDGRLYITEVRKNDPKNNSTFMDGTSAITRSK